MNPPGPSSPCAHCHMVQPPQECTHCPTTPNHADPLTNTHALSPLPLPPSRPGPAPAAPGPRPTKPLPGSAAAAAAAASLSGSVRSGRGFKGGPSRYRGVVWHKSNCKWEARIYEGGRQKFLGYYVEEEAAALAYDDYAGRLGPWGWGVSSLYPVMRQRHWHMTMQVGCVCVCMCACMSAVLRSLCCPAPTPGREGESGHPTERALLLSVCLLWPYGCLWPLCMHLTAGCFIMV